LVGWLHNYDVIGWLASQLGCDWLVGFTTMMCVVGWLQNYDVIGWLASQLGRDWLVGFTTMM
jgi:hypothetical protein